MSASCPALLISAMASGQGKTLCSAALARAWRNRGLDVRVFKCGPDFLDPMVLQMASGNPVYNLDLGMCGERDGSIRLYQAALEADVIIVEGVMGLYDGTPSSADIAARFGLPVMLTIDASGMAQTFGAVAAGLLAYQPQLKAAGVLANKVGSSGHAQMLKDSLPPHLGWFGALQQDAAIALPERHLGLFRASEIADLDARIEAAAHALADSSALDLPPAVTFAPAASSTQTAALAGKTIAIARDAAFCFIYPANLDCLQTLGAQLVFFSPLHDKQLPVADAYWLPGGYPELHTAEIGANQGMQQGLRAACEAGKPILAECGGMLALAESINGQPAFGLLPGQCHIESRFQGLGTQHVTLGQGDIGGKTRGKIRGDIDGETEGKIAAHTFHYGVFNTPMAVAAQASSAYGTGEAVYRHGSISASFLHFYFPSNLAVTAGLFSA